MQLECVGDLRQVWSSPGRLGRQSRLQVTGAQNSATGGGVRSAHLRMRPISEIHPQFFFQFSFEDGDRRSSVLRVYSQLLSLKAPRHLPQGKLGNISWGSKRFFSSHDSLFGGPCSSTSRPQNRDLRADCAQVHYLRTPTQEPTPSEEQLRT